MPSEHGPPANLSLTEEASGIRNRLGHGLRAPLGTIVYRLQKERVKAQNCRAG